MLSSSSTLGSNLYSPSNNSTSPIIIFSPTFFHSPNLANLIQSCPFDPSLGPRVGSKVQDCIKFAKLGEWKKVGKKIIVGDVELLEGEYKLESKVLEDESTQLVLGENILVFLDLKLDQKLIREGISRDVIRMVQNLRREKDLEVSDFINITINADKIIIDSIKENYSYICSQALADNIVLSDKLKNDYEKIEGHKINIDF